MVATRNHPVDFPPPAPTDSPPKRSTRTPTAAKPKEPTSPTTPSHPPRTSSLPSWSHTPSNLTLLWLLLSLPLVTWDTGYVLLRPWTLPGGPLHSPLYTPYALYGQTDKVYSAEAYHAGLGFTAAQASLNVVETAAYVWYLWTVWKYGVGEGGKRGTGGMGLEGERGWLGWMGASRTVYGRQGKVAVLVGYTTFVATLAKTVLYWLNEAWSGFEGVGHNSWSELVFLWIIPNGLWIVFPMYLGYVFGAEIVEGLGVAAEGGKKDR